MSLRVLIGDRAEADLAHQYRWYSDHVSVTLADRFLDAFDLTVGRLVEHPLLGHPRRFRARELVGLRSIPVAGKFGVHHIFYRTDLAELSIERVMHGARDLPRRLRELPAP